MLWRALATSSSRFARPARIAELEEGSSAEEGERMLEVDEWRLGFNQVHIVYSIVQPMYSKTIQFEFVNELPYILSHT